MQGAGGAHVDSSDFELDRKHVAAMDAVPATGSHRRFETENDVLMPDCVVSAIDEAQRCE